MKLHIIMHESFESPAAIVSWANQRKHSVTYSKVYQGDPLPMDTEAFDWLIIMGGPQSPATSLAECPYFNAQAEIALIKKAIAANKYVLGVCLGAQLIGEAMGAAFEHSPYKEIGVFEITLTKAAEEDPILADFPPVFPVGHWHGDMPGLTQAAIVLAYSKGCPRQIVKYTPRVYGFQCHFEFTQEAIEAMIQYSEDDLMNHSNSPYVQTKEVLRQQNYPTINGLLFKFLDQWQALY